MHSELKLLTKSLSSLLILKCSNVVVRNSAFECDYQQCGLTILDAKGYSMMNNIKSGQLLLVHSNATSDATTEIMQVL